MSTLQKIIVCGLAALFILILMLGWGYFAYHGKTDIGVFIAQIGTLITIAVGLITAFAGHQAAQSGQGGSAPLAAGTALLSEPARLAPAASPSVEPSTTSMPNAAPPAAAAATQIPQQ